MAEPEEGKRRVPIGVRVVVVVFALLGPAIVGFGVWARSQLGKAPQAAVLATGWTGRGAIAIDETLVYGATAAGIRTAAKRGGAEAVLAPPAPGDEPVSVAVDATHVYWTAAAREPGRPALLRVARQGGAAEVLAPARGPEQIGPGEIAIDERAAYWVACGGADPRDPAARGMVLRAEKAGGEPAAVAQALPCPSALALDATHVYWVDGTALRRAPKAGGDAQVLLADASVKGPVIVVGDRVYLNRPGPAWVPASGGAATGLTAGGEGTLAGADAAFVYYVHPPGRGGEVLLSRSRHTGGGIELISRLERGVADLAVDDSGVYFTTPTGELLALRR